LAALSAGCASTPQPRLYSLSATSPASAASSNVSVSVGPVSVPALVDRPQIVVTTADSQARLDELNRWSAPLHESLAEVVAQNLAAILGSSQVTVFPKISSAASQYRVAIDVQRFESMPGVSALLEAAWTVRRRADQASRTRRASVREAVHDASYDALAAAHSRAAERLSRDIAEAIRALDGASLQPR
jgi:uncharacterized lipoprotein YmbA